jgi:hypothetical protein
MTKNFAASALVIQLLNLNSSAFLAFVNHLALSREIAIFSSQKVADKLSRYLEASITFQFRLFFKLSYTISGPTFQNLLYHNQIIQATIGAENDVQFPRKYGSQSRLIAVVYISSQYI